MVHILNQKGALLCALLILLTALPLAAQRKRRAAAPLPALPDTVYLLDHYQESRHWMRDLDKIKRWLMNYGRLPTSHAFLPST